MTKHLYRVLVFVTALACAGFSAPLMADAGQFKLDMILAERGDPDAQYYVANAYEEGRGTEEDMGKAFEWYRKAAEQQHGAAQYKLGVMYENGMGVEEDLKQAMEWYKQAEENGSTLADERLDKAAFARSEAVMKRRITAMKEKRRQQERAEKQRQLEAQKRKQAQAKARARQAALREQKAAQQKRRVAASSKPAASQRVNIPDLADLVLTNEWQQKSRPADFLPSDSTNCLRASDAEVVCFSAEKQRIINRTRVTYTTKATLSDFTADGSFRVRYNYNAIKLEQTDAAGFRTDPHGLKLEKGWQEPRLAAQCRTSDRVNLYCQRGKVKLHYRR